LKINLSGLDAVSQRIRYHYMKKQSIVEALRTMCAKIKKGEPCMTFLE
jgi:hypothetical protein